MCTWHWVWEPSPFCQTLHVLFCLFVFLGKDRVKIRQHRKLKQVYSQDYTEVTILQRTVIIWDQNPRGIYGTVNNKQASASRVQFWTLLKLKEKWLGCLYLWTTAFSEGDNRATGRRASHQKLPSLLAAVLPDANKLRTAAAEAQLSTLTASSLPKRHLVHVAELLKDFKHLMMEKNRQLEAEIFALAQQLRGEPSPAAFWNHCPPRENVLPSTP